MDKALIVGFGGFLGSVGRYAVTGGVYRLVPAAGFPWGTLVVNVCGCALIGVLGALADVRNVFTPEGRSFLFIGVLGGFTTFSTFAYETLALARDGESLRAGANALVQLIGCLVAVWLGDTLVRVAGGLTT